MGFGGYMLPPEVPRGGGNLGPVVAADAETERNAGIEGELGQRPLAEAVGWS